jgi:hypothetical protein
MAQQEVIMQILKEQQEILMQIMATLRQKPKISILRHIKAAENNENADFIPNKVLTTIKTASRMNEPRYTYLTLEKPPASKVRAKKSNTIEAAKHNKALRAMYIAIGRELKIRAAERDEPLNEKNRLIRRTKKWI